MNDTMAQRLRTDMNQDSPADEHHRQWVEINRHGNTLSDHGHRLKTVEGRVDRLESHMSEQYGAVLTKLDGVSGEVRSLNEKYIRAEAAAQAISEREDKAISAKWPLVISIVMAGLAVCSVAIAAAMLAKP
ncbi:hypothetical protein HCU74_08350 [Spongiibacter sp. KMU-166]|uniref:Uncharacterized protein n=1 Tax=Spongiibacter thalassae TaxID=2721624 RepID=A0ABX1GER0_9GAMM|nr:hypothetical protein [Spongiibacter thalassae]NKI17426.1 hypothetical protein [Spongiibacter thalassae]